MAKAIKFASAILALSVNKWIPMAAFHLQRIQSDFYDTKGKGANAKPLVPIT
jgi:hypothetical protein